MLPSQKNENDGFIQDGDENIFYLKHFLTSF
jgi:hypothetical protein